MKCGAWNIALKLDVSPVSLDSKAAHDPRVEWLVATSKHKTETQPVLEKPTET